MGSLNLFFLSFISGLLLGRGVYAEDTKTPSAQKANWVGHILRQPAPGAEIHGLDFYNDRVPVVLIPQNGKLRPLIELRGHFLRPGWVLHQPDGKPVSSAPDQIPSDFAIYAYIRGKVNEVDLVAEGPKKEIERERVFIFSPEAQEFEVVDSWDQFQLSTGITWFDYKQTNFGEYKSDNVLLSFQYKTPYKKSKFGFLGRLDMTVISFASNSVANGPQLLEGKFLASYKINNSPISRWDTSLLFGASYATLFANGSPFGFRDLIAPDVGFSYKYYIDASTAWVGDVNFVSIGNLIKFDQFGFDARLARAKLLKSLHRLELGGGFATFRYDASQTVDTKLVFLTVGYSL